MMTSVVDKYYRQISENIDNIKMKFDISSLLVKSKEHDSKIDTNKNNISGNKSLIDTNESNISGNKSLIDTNTNNITNNLSKINNNTSLIDNNRNNISSNSSLINTYIKGLNLINTNTSNNSSDISNNLSLIDTNKNNITNNYNLTQINKKKSEFNTSLIDNNRNNISSNLGKINDIDDKVSSNNNLISNNFNSILPLKSNYIIDNIILLDLNANKDISFKSNIKKILVYETNIFYRFKSNSYIEINESLLYLYNNIKTSYYILKENYLLLDQDDTILDEFSFNIKSKGFIYNNLHIFDNCYFFKLKSDITTLKLRVYLERINYDNDTEFNLKLTNEFQNNFICLKYYKNTL